jgi:deazaflavin-dependent oxidoreductase (nitroreductase family)
MSIQREAGDPRWQQVETLCSYIDLCSRYAHGVDKGERESFLQIWTETAEWNLGEAWGNHEGIVEIEKGWCALREAFHELHHGTNNHQITDFSDGRAVGRCDAFVPGTDAFGVGVATTASYIDTMERGPDGEWRFTQRDITIHYLVPWTLPQGIEPSSRTYVMGAAAVHRNGDTASGRAFDDANAFHRLMRTFAATTMGVALFRPTAHHLDRVASKFTGGKRSFAGVALGVPAVMLTTTGAKSGQTRTTPVFGVPHPEGLAVIASNFGGPKHPAWYHNLRANPRAALSIEGNAWQVDARLATPSERDRIWAQGLELYPGWRKYESRAGARHIEAFVLSRV